MADLTTIDKVRRYLFGNEPEMSADDILSSLITSSSAWVEARLGRTFAVRSVTDTKNGDGTRRMLLDESPVNSVTSVMVSGEAVTKRAVVTADGWVQEDDGVSLVGSYFTKGVQNVVIVYSAGEVVPAPVEQAVIEHVAFRYKRRNNLGKSSESIAGESSIYADAGVLAGIEDLIAPYRVIAFA